MLSDLPAGFSQREVLLEGLLPHLACIPSVRHLLSQSYWVPEPSPRPVPSSQWPSGFPLLPIAARNWKHWHTFLAPFILPPTPQSSAAFSALQLSLLGGAMQDPNWWTLAGTPISGLFILFHWPNRLVLVPL